MFLEFTFSFCSQTFFSERLQIEKDLTYQTLQGKFQFSVIICSITPLLSVSKVVYSLLVDL